MSETAPPSLNLWDSTGAIEARFSDEPKARGRLALARDGANEQEASTAVQKISEACARYIAFGPCELVPDKQVKAEIAAVAKAAEQFNRAVNAMSAPASARLLVGLRPERALFLGTKAPRLGNPDPIYESSRGGFLSLGSAFNRKIVVPADMSAKFDRVRWDMAQLADRIRRVGDFRSRRGRPENWRVRMLFEEVIAEWANAAGQAPAASQRNGLVDSPLLDLLRALVYPTSEYPEVREALSDAIYLDVLARMKIRRTGLMSSPAIPARRRRPSRTS